MADDSRAGDSNSGGGILNILKSGFPIKSIWKNHEDDDSIIKDALK